MSKPACDCIVSRVTILHEKTCASLRPTEPVAQVVSIPGKSGEQSVADQPCVAAPDSKVMLTREAVEEERDFFKRQMCEANWKETNSIRAARIDGVCDQAIGAIDLQAEVERSKDALRLTTNMMAGVARKAERMHAEIERLKFDNEQLSVTSVNLLERAERAEAALKPAITDTPVGWFFDSEHSDNPNDNFVYGERRPDEREAWIPLYSVVLKPVSEREISQIADRFLGPHEKVGPYADRSGVIAACREVLRRVGVEVKP